MSDDFAQPRVRHDTVILQAALRPPGDPGQMGHNTVRLPVRIVWRESDGPDIGAPATRTSQQRHSANFSSPNPVASFLPVNDALDRTAQGSVSDTPILRNRVAPFDGDKETRSPSTALRAFDDKGSLLDGARGPMMRPAGLSPQFFVRQGIADREFTDALIKSSGESGAIAATAFQAGRMAQFRQGGRWDAQRIDGRNHAEFVDYATFALGLYAAAAGIPEDEVLTIENVYAGLNSSFPQKVARDPHYANLPERNVSNTRKGYEAYQQGRVGTSEAR